MKQTNDLNSKIKNYAALATGIAAATGATAQVQYTDLNPDVVLTLSGTTLYTLDFNGGGLNPDIAFQVQQNTSYGAFTFYGYPVDLYGNGAVAGFGTAAPATNGFMGSVTGTGSNTFMAMQNLSSGNMIGPAQSFTQTNGIVGYDVVAKIYGSTVGSSSFGKHGTTPGFVGIRFDIAGSTHYGWARVSYDSPTQMTIYDYAYDQTANTGILAGDMGTPTSVEELGMEGLVQFLNNQNRVVVKSNVTNGLINVHSISGQAVNSMNIVNDREVIDLNGLAAGIYVINVTADEGSISKKVYVR